MSRMPDVPYRVDSSDRGDPGRVGRAMSDWISGGHRSVAQRGRGKHRLKHSVTGLRFYGSAVRVVCGCASKLRIRLVRVQFRRE